MKPLFMYKILLLVFCFWTTSLLAQSDSLNLPLQGKASCNSIYQKASWRLSCHVTKPADNEGLYVIDGIPKTFESFAELKPEEIESIYISKDVAVRVTTCRSTKAVIVITLKKLRNTRLKILDEVDSTGIANASVQLNINGKTTVISANQNGEAEVLGLSKKQPFTVTASSVGYLSEENQLSFDSSNQKLIIRLKRHFSSLENVVISSGLYRSIRCGGCWVKVTQCTIHKTSASKNTQQQFLIYPNPASQNASISILPRYNITGRYNVVTISGQIIQSGILNHTADQPIILQTVNCPPGTYFVRLHDDESNKTLSEKFIIK